jgi:hypothetical protein
MKMKELKNADLQEVNGGFDGLLPQFPINRDYRRDEPSILVIWQ